MNNFQKKIREFRNQKGYTQEQFAEELGIKKSLLGAYEEGRAIPPIEKLMLFSDAMGLSLDQLMQENQKNPQEQKNTLLSIEFDQVEEVKSPNFEEKRYVSNNETSIRTPLVRKKDFEIYIKNYYRPEYVKELDSFVFPIDVDKDTRAFEGLENTPLENSIIIGSFVQFGFDNTFPLNEPCIIVHKKGIIYRNFHGAIEAKNALLLSSDEQGILPEELPLEELLEIWKIEGSFTLGQTKFRPSTNQLNNLVNQLKNEIKKFDQH